ncbi:hypothetical protein [Arthrobacter sp. 9MFCol3.1]|uniref:hypothetical protein n=1 Tax=Arthrobacter sp. 9MFCol3.1 TaxID=1150398 RepID=UPI00047D7524|nr:hypothetical protein [Arthrobacter sp. 9MFCol3.1]
MDIDEIPAGLQAGEKQISITTRRSYSNAEAMLSRAVASWVSLSQFSECALRDIPSCISFEWKTPERPAGKMLC